LPSDHEQISTHLLEARLSLRDGIRPCRQRDADKHGDDSRSEAEAQGFAQRDGADKRSNDRYLSPLQDVIDSFPEM
jgi:hypothetical protein